MQKHTKSTKDTPEQMLLLVELGLEKPEDLPPILKVRYYRELEARKIAYSEPEDLTPCERDDTN